MCSINCGWVRETFWQYVTIHGLDKYNTMFQNVKRVLHQNKVHTKNFIWIAILQADFLDIEFIFPAYIFAIIFGTPKDSLTSARTD